MTEEQQPRPRPLPPPYGPATGMMQGITLLRRTAPARVDTDFLRSHGVAPGNEYKVVGALRFLGIIDEKGHPTDNSRLLKTRGAAATLALQDMVRAAYRGLFAQVSPREATRDAIHNYFITEMGLGAEMAAKATRFLVELCRLAEIDLSAAAEAPKRTPEPRLPRHPRKDSRAAPLETRDAPIPQGSPTIVLALTAETAAMSEDELAGLFRKVFAALSRARGDR